MAPKRVVEKVEAKHTLAAVLLADSFTQSFRPITVERPKVLLPLVNAPLLDYTLEWLAMNKVEEVVVFCCAHADQIKSYLSDSKWMRQREMKVTPVVSTNCLSAGEAMRLLDQKDIIKTDFILINGDTVSNMQLGPALAAHRARREKDKNAIMTMVMKSAKDPCQRLRLGDTGLVVALDPESGRLLKYTELDGPDGSSKKSSVSRQLKIDAAFFSERDGVQIRSNLLDTHIAICAPEVLYLFSDNFDYQNLRRDFVGGVLSEEELGNKLYVHELQGEYAARVHNLRSYDAVSRDIMQRWAFPFVPDTNVFAKGGAWGPSAYRHTRGIRYMEVGSTIARSAAVGPDVCIGAGTSIGDNARVAHCVIGRNCRIGKGATLQGCYLHDNVTIGDGASLSSALVCERAVVGADAKVEPGALLSFGVVVAPRHTVPAHARVTLCRQLQSQVSYSDDELEYTTAATDPTASRRASETDTTDDAASAADGASSSLGDGSELVSGRSMEMPSSLTMRAAEALAAGRAAPSGVAFDAGLVGQGGAGFGWPVGDAQDVVRYSIAPPPMRSDAGAGEDDNEDDAASGVHGDDEAADSEPSGAEEEMDDEERSFKREVSETFLRCVKMRFDQTNAVIELNGLKIAEDRTFADCARYIFTTLLSLCLPASRQIRGDYRELFPMQVPDITTQAGKKDLLGRFRALLEEWGSLLQRFLRSEDDQVEVLLTFEEFCSEENVFEGSGEQGKVFASVFPLVLQALYDCDVVSEEAFLTWADEKKLAEEGDRIYLNKASQFIDWLRTADEDEDEDEDEDGSDEDDD